MHTPRLTIGTIALLTLLAPLASPGLGSAPAAPAPDECRTEPGLSAALLERHRARTDLAGPIPVEAGAPGTPASLVAAEADETPLSRLLGANGALVEQGGVVDMGGIRVQVDDGSAVLGTFTTGFVIDTVRLSRSYYAAWPDDVEVLSFFPNFDHREGTFQSLVRNAVQGINVPLVNDTFPYGSAGRLESLILFTNFMRRPADPFARIGTDNNTPLSLLAHEFGHRWGAFVRFDADPGAGVTPSSDLLGRAAAHWCYFHDTRSAFAFPGGTGTGMSVLEGNLWRQDFDNTFSTAGATDGYSPLDLYLMGLMRPDEVPPFFYVTNVSSGSGTCSSLPVSVPPNPARSIIGTRRTVTIDDIIRVEGPRQPASDAAPRAFRQAMVLVTRRGHFPSPAEVERLERLRLAWEPYFRDATGGRATVDTTAANRPGAAVTFAFVRLPPDLQAGVGFRGALLALDAEGRRAIDYRGTVRFSSLDDPAAAVPADLTFEAGHAGYREIPDPFIFTASGTLSITATDRQDAAITGTRSGLVVEAATVAICVPGSPGSGVSDARPWGFGATYGQQGGVRFQYLVHASDLGRPALITGLDWTILGGPEAVLWEQVGVTMAHKRDYELRTFQGEASLDQNLAAGTDRTTVLFGAVERQGMVGSGRYHIQLLNPFAYNGVDHLLLEVRYAGGGPSGLSAESQLAGSGVIAVERLGPNFPVPMSRVSTLCLGARLPSGILPVISGVAAEQVSNVSAIIAWRTSPSTDGRIEFAEAGQPLAPVPLADGFALTHAIPLAGLRPDTLYEYRIRSRDIDNQESVAGPFLFRTTDVRPTVTAFEPRSLRLGTLNRLVRVFGANIFPGARAEFTAPDFEGDLPPPVDPTIRVIASSRVSDNELDLGVAVDDTAPLGPRRIRIINSDGFAAHSEVYFGVQPPRSAADTDGSGRVDGHDLARLARSFGVGYPAPAFDLAADLTGDLFVDGVDLALLADVFGGPPLP